MRSRNIFLHTLLLSINCMVFNIVLMSWFYSLLFFTPYNEEKHITLGKDIYLLKKCNLSDSLTILIPESGEELYHSSVHIGRQCSWAHQTKESRSWLSAETKVTIKRDGIYFNRNGSRKMEIFYFFFGGCKAALSQVNMKHWNNIYTWSHELQAW